MQKPDGSDINGHPYAILFLDFFLREQQHQLFHKRGRRITTATSTAHFHFTPNHPVLVTPSRTHPQILHTCAGTGYKAETIIVAAHASRDKASIWQSMAAKRQRQHMYANQLPVAKIKKNTLELAVLKKYEYSRNLSSAEGRPFNWRFCLATNELAELWI